MTALGLVGREPSRMGRSNFGNGCGVPRGIRRLELPLDPSTNCRDSNLGKTAHTQNGILEIAEILIIHGDNLFRVGLIYFFNPPGLDLGLTRHDGRSRPKL